ncbi:unnamed protein product [Prunus armeniaca]
MNYNDYDSYGSNSQSIGQPYGQYNFIHQGGPNNQYGSSSQFGGQYDGHNYVGGFGDQYGGHNYIGGNDPMNQNGSIDQNGFGGQTNQGGYSGQYDSTYQYGFGSQFNCQHDGNKNYSQNNMIYQNYANGQHAIMANTINWLEGNTLTKMPKIIRPISMISLVMAPTKRIILMAIMAKIFLV